MLLLDLEIYKDYFLFQTLDTKTREVVSIDFYPGKTLDTETIRNMMLSDTTIGFNSLKFDLPILICALAGWDNQRLKDLSDQIIFADSVWDVLREHDINVPYDWKHIDLIEISPGKASLKIYGGRLYAPKMQDLPIDPSASIGVEDREIIRRYCLNDLETTFILLKKLAPQLKLRAEMTDIYDIDLRSKSDAQIAEILIRQALEKSTKQKYSAPTLGESYTFRYKFPRIIKFKQICTSAVYNKIRSEYFVLAENGSVRMPDWLAAQRIKIGQAEYQMGIGGLHSCEKSQYFEADEDYRIGDWDVTSMYPNIILQQGMAPKLLGEPFLNLYKTFVEKRIEAKKSGNKVMADTYKIVLNSSYGKFGSKYSFLYSPDLLAQTTLTGQLSLLMLIERLDMEGLRVISANTDGIVVYFHKDRERDVERIMFDWMLDTTYGLERTDYRSIASRDVNNYVAVKLDGSVKGKGIFAEPSLSKNPDGTVVYRAVAQHIASGTPIESTILGCKNIFDFCTVRRVTGGAVWRGVLLGKAIRFYHSTEGDVITYAKNGNRVPNSEGTMPMMDALTEFPTDVDYQFYLEKAAKLLKEVGYARA